MRIYRTSPTLHSFVILQGSLQKLYMGCANVYFGVRRRIHGLMAPHINSTLISRRQTVTVVEFCKLKHTLPYDILQSLFTSAN